MRSFNKTTKAKGSEEATKKLTASHEIRNIATQSGVTLLLTFHYVTPHCFTGENKKQQRARKGNGALRLGEEMRSTHNSKFWAPTWNS